MKRKARASRTTRHESNQHLVALIEILCPGNKASAGVIQAFAARVAEALWHRVNVVLIDLLPPGPYDPEGPHALIQAAVSGEPYALPERGRLTFASYEATPAPAAYLFHPPVGEALPEVPLFLSEGCYVPLRMGEAYSRAFDGEPAHIQRDVAVRPNHLT